VNFPRLEEEMRRAAEAVEPGCSARLFVGVTDGDSVFVRRFSQSADFGRHGWIDLVAELRGDLLDGIEKIRDVMWPECPAKARRLITMVASMAAKFIPKG